MGGERRIHRRKSSLLACRCCMAKTRKMKSFLEGLEGKGTVIRGSLLCPDPEVWDSWVVQKRRGTSACLGECACAETGSRRLGFGLDGGEFGIPCWEYLVSMTHRVLDRIRIWLGFVVPHEAVSKQWWAQKNKDSEWARNQDRVQATKKWIRRTWWWIVCEDGVGRQWKEEKLPWLLAQAAQKTEAC